MAMCVNGRRCAVLLATLGSLALGTMTAPADDWPKTPSQALAFERADRMPPTSFYGTPTPLPPGEPGELIRSQVVTGYALPKGVRAVRILYHSQSATGEDVPASGVVLLPAGAAPPGRWPVIAWGHGTSGVARICGPSEMKDVYYGAELFPFLRAGFALVAADYAGLGTEVAHAFSSLNAEANDIINAVRAAHAAVGELSPRWVVDGHSQGGGAAWLVAQREARIRDFAGGADDSVPPQSIRSVIERACRGGYALEFRVFPRLDHSAAMRETISYQLHWIRARFDNRPAPDNCAQWARH